MYLKTVRARIPRFCEFVIIYKSNDAILLFRKINRPIILSAACLSLIMMLWLTIIQTILSLLVHDSMISYEKEADSPRRSPNTPMELQMNPRWEN